MEGEVGDTLVVRVVVLQQLLRAKIPQLRRTVARGRSDARGIRIEGSRIDDVGVVVKGAHAPVSAAVPELERLVIAAREQQPACRCTRGAQTRIRASREGPRHRQARQWLVYGSGFRCSCRAPSGENLAERTQLE